MDDARFQEAKQAYDSGDFRAAAKGFLAAAGREPEGTGAAYHMAGNSLMRLRRHADAVTVYGQALRDELYDRRGAVQSNLAAAHAALGEYAEAVEAYRAALEEHDYVTHYRALQGMAGSLFEMGKHAEAASAYRQAALDGDNPDPGKALNNLGLSFMSLGRPADAVEAYKAALGFDDYSGRGRALANLGLAFHVLGEHRQAVKSFEKAIQLHGHELSDQARTAFAKSQEASKPQREVVEGWSTGELPPLIESLSDDDDEFEYSAAEQTQVMAAVPASGMSPAALNDDPSSTGELFGTVPESEFFTLTDDEMKDRDRSVRRAERDAKRADRNPWTLVASVALVVVVIVASIAAAYFSGLGFPTQRMTVTGMLDTRADGNAVEGYWVAVPAADIDKEMAKLPVVDVYEIASVERSPRTSRVTVAVTPENGSPLRYEITLAREGIGWKVAGIENDWRSTGGGS